MGIYKHGITPSSIKAETAARYCVFDSRNVQIASYTTRKAAMRYAIHTAPHCGHDVVSVGRCLSSGRITHMWGLDGTPLVFCSHGGDHGEWRRAT